MHTPPPLSTIQSHIMLQLFMHPSLSFAQINTQHVPSDQFSYHLRQLVKHGLIHKDTTGAYALTDTGKTQAIMLDKQTMGFIRQGLLACRIIAPRTVQGQTEYLVQERTKVPYHGFIAEPGGKIHFGEDITQAGARALLFETGLKADLQAKGVVHFKDVYSGEIVQDKYFFVLLASNLQGSVTTHGPTGRNTWMSLPDLAAHPRVHQGVTDMIAIAEAPGFGFTEANHITETY